MTTNTTTAGVTGPDLDKQHERTLTELLICCMSWQPQVCVLGNVRAGDAAAAIQDALNRRATLPAGTGADERNPPAVPAIPNGWEPVYLVWSESANAWIDAGLVEWQEAEERDRRTTYQPTQG